MVVVCSLRIPYYYFYDDERRHNRQELLVHELLIACRPDRRYCLAFTNQEFDNPHWKDMVLLVLASVYTYKVWSGNFMKVTTYMAIPRSVSFGWAVRQTTPHWLYENFVYSIHWMTQISFEYTLGIISRKKQMVKIMARQSHRSEDEGVRAYCHHCFRARRRWKLDLDYLCETLDSKWVPSFVWNCFDSLVVIMEFFQALRTRTTSSNCECIRCSR